MPACGQTCTRTARSSEKALSAFSELKAAGLQLTVITYNTLISALGNGGQWEEALSTFAELKTAGLQPTVITYNALIRALSTGGGEPQLQQALDVFVNMLSTDISPDNVTCCEVISTLLLLGRRGEAAAFFRSRRSQEYATVFPRPRTAREAWSLTGRASL